MAKIIEAAAVLAAQAGGPRRPKATDHRFRVRFTVLPDDEALQRLPLPDAPPHPAPDSSDDACYAPNLSGGGVGIYGELRTLRGQSLHRGDFVTMEIRPAGKRRPIRCMGLVAWVRVNQDAGLFRAGVGFVGVDQRDLAPR